MAAGNSEMKSNSAIELLNGIDAELREITRGKEFAQWNQGAVGELGKLLNFPPFDNFREIWIYTGDGGAIAASALVGRWALHKLVAKESAEAIIEGFEREARRASATYVELLPVAGVRIDRKCDLAEGVSLIPASEVPLAWRVMLHDRYHPLPFAIPAESCFLVQHYEVTPAYEFRTADSVQPGQSRSMPATQDRETMRHRVRLASIAAGNGSAELPVSLFVPETESPFMGGTNNQTVRPVPAIPLVCFPVDADEVKSTFDQLCAFKNGSSLERAIDRIGRARTARNSVDASLELGMAAEITLMHGQNTSNTEITYKIASRAAWLLGDSAESRIEIFGEMKRLYRARSDAVHTGKLSKASDIDLQNGEALVVRAIRSILRRGEFPDWESLVLSGS